MKVTIENEIDGFVHRAVVESSGVTADEVLNECLQCMAGMSFHAKSIEEAILGKAEEIQDNPTE